MAGWIFNNDALTRFLPSQPSMTFVTAFTFWSCAIGIWLIDLIFTDHSEISLVLLPANIMLIILMVTTILAAGIYKVHTGITDLFLEGNNPVGSPLPGVPAIGTIVGFLEYCICATTVLFDSKPWKRLITYLGIFIIVMGFVAILGYLLKLPILYSVISESSVPMSPNTATTFVLLGLDMVLLERNSKHYENK